MRLNSVGKKKKRKAQLTTCFLARRTILRDYWASDRPGFVRLYLACCWLVKNENLLNLSIESSSKESCKHLHYMKRKQRWNIGKFFIIRCTEILTTSPGHSHFWISVSSFVIGWDQNQNKVNLAERYLKQEEAELFFFRWPCCNAAFSRKQNSLIKIARKIEL